MGWQVGRWAAVTVVEVDSVAVVSSLQQVRAGMAVQQAEEEVGAMVGVLVAWVNAVVEESSQLPELEEGVGHCRPPQPVPRSERHMLLESALPAHCRGWHP